VGYVKTAAEVASVMTPDIWISTTTSTVTFENNTRGSHWELVGTVDAAQETGLTKHIQVLLSLRSTAPRIPGF
jgi:hypothetical protein